MIHGYICECRSRRCRVRLYLAPETFEALSKKGMVLSAACARRDKRHILEQYRGYNLVVAANRGRPVGV